ncbi:MAG: SIR2 family protein [Gammaproteobacteria bacterium]|nr:SIR2 family protein [Gammaproteobacteria bacterium]
MRFITNGPDIPSDIIKAQEEGKLIFFCGAGISIKLGLPDFNQLVDKVRNKLAVDKISIPAGESSKSNGQTKYYQPDLLLNNIARHLGPNSPDGHKKVKKTIIEELTIKPENNKADYGTHKAILSLSQHKDKYRLITTNVDHGFKDVADNLQIDAYPYLPPATPKDIKNPIHLHGIINTEDPNGDNLIFTTSDFGKAYLTDGRATKFITELLSAEFTILLIGYSLNDPILRYIVDELAYEDKLQNKIFTLTPQNDEQEWLYKGVTPITYDDNNNHCSLHESLIKWSAFAKSGKKGILLEHAQTDPATMRNSPETEHHVDWVCWAIENGDKETIQYFTKLDPPIEWLEVFTEKKILSSETNEQTNCVYTTTKPRSHYNLNTTQSILLRNWIKRHLNSRELFFILIKIGITELHPKFKDLVISALKDDNNKMSEDLKKTWELCLKLRNNPTTSHTLNEHTTDDEIINNIKPSLQIKKQGTTNNYKKNINLKNIFELYINDYYLWLTINHLKDKEEKLASLAFKLTDNLITIYQILELYDDANNSHRHRPSIDEHTHNDHQDKWGEIIGLTAQAWVALSKKNEGLAKSLIVIWQNQKYVIFRRLTLYAMTTDSNISSNKETLDYLLENDGQWLFNNEAKCETYNILEKRSHKLTKQQINKIALTILSNEDNQTEDIYWLLRNIKDNLDDKQNLPKEAIAFINEHDKQQDRQREEWEKRFLFNIESGWNDENISEKKLGQISSEELAKHVLSPRISKDELTNIKDSIISWLYSIQNHSAEAFFTKILSKLWEIKASEYAQQPIIYGNNLDSLDKAINTHQDLREKHFSEVIFR